jgi:hypothetical protein
MGRKTFWKGATMTTSMSKSLDYQKHGLNLHKNQTDIANSRVALRGQEPGEFEAEAGLLNDFQASNQTRKPGWRALLDGMASGLKYGLNAAEAKKKKETYANMDQLFTSLEEASLQLQKQNERNGRRQEDMETKIIPSVVGYLTYLQNNPTYDEAFTNLNSRFEQIKAVMPQAGISDGELVALSPRNYEVGIFKDKRTGQLKELPVSSLLPPDLLKGRPDLNTYERARDAEKMALERSRLPSSREQASRGQAQPSANQTLADEETQTYLELYGLLKNRDIDPTSGIGSGIRDWIAQNIPVVGGLAAEGAANRQAYSQATSNLKGQTFRKHGYRNQAEFENIHTLPDTLPKEEALKFVEAELRKRGIPVPDGATALPPDVPNPPPSGAVPETQQVKVQDPSTGQIGLLSPEEAKIAISRGGIRIE